MKLTKYLTDKLNQLKPALDNNPTDNSLRVTQCMYYLFWYGSMNAISFLATMVSNTLAYVFVGMKTNSDGQAAHGLGYSIGNMFVLTIALGLVNGMDTLCPLSIGVGRREGCWAYLFQALFAVVCLIPFLTPLMIFSEPWLRYLTPSPTVAHIASQYLIASLPSLFFIGFFEAARKFLTFHNYIRTHTIIAVIAIPIQVFFLYVYLFLIDNGTMGAGFARSSTYATSVLMSGLYIWSLRNHFGWAEFCNFKTKSINSPPNGSEERETSPSKYSPNVCIEVANSASNSMRINQKTKSSQQDDSRALNPDFSHAKELADNTIEHNTNIQTFDSPRKNNTKSFPLTQASTTSEFDYSTISYNDIILDAAKSTSAKLKNSKVNFQTIENGNDNDHSSPMHIKKKVYNHPSNTNSLLSSELTKKPCKDESLTCDELSAKTSETVDEKQTSTSSLNMESQEAIIALKIGESEESKKVVSDNVSQQDETCSKKNQTNPKKQFIVVHKYWWQGIPTFFYVAIPSAFLCAFEWIAFEAQIVGAGYLGESEQTGIAISASLGSIMFIIHLSLGILTNREVGKAMSSRCYKNAITFAKAGVFLALLLSTILTILVLAIRWQLAQVYTNIYATQLIVYKNFLWQALIIVFDAVHVVFSGIIKAQNLQWYGCLIDAVCLLCIMEASGFSLAYATPLKGQGFLIGTLIGLSFNLILYLIMLVWCVDWHERSNVLSS